MPELGGNGYVIVGDAARMCMNLGYTIRGMDLAIESGMCAADAVNVALARRKIWSVWLSCMNVKSRLLGLLEGFEALQE